MFGSLTARLPRLGTWPRVALIACCLVLALDSAVTSRASGAARAGTAPVVVAARVLAAGQVLAAADVRIERWPRSVAVAADLHRRSDVTGRRLSTALTAGEPVSSTRLVGRDLAAGLPPGQVVAAVQVADPHTGDLVRTGDRVEFSAVPRAADGFAPASAEAPASASSRDAEVLASGLRVLAVLPGTDADGAEIVVATTPGTAAQLAHAAATQMIDVFGEPP